MADSPPAVVLEDGDESRVVELEEEEDSGLGDSLVTAIESADGISLPEEQAATRDSHTIPTIILGGDSDPSCPILHSLS